MRTLSIVLLLVVLGASASAAGPALEKDRFETTAGPLTITFIGHGTLLMQLGSLRIHVDPWSRLADYATMPDADLILITHHHGDHLDPAAIAEIRTPHTAVITSARCADRLECVTVMANGDARMVKGVYVQAVPAYNIKHKRPNGDPFHPQGEGNGYVLTFGDTRVYIAGDTEYIPEMDLLAGVDIAFLPVNLPYTMTLEMAADAARRIQPKVLYPYHFGDTDIAKLPPLLADVPGVEVRLRRMP
ncbi:MAG TPA: MBL fold metallo-hydrolase [Acidobacteriota bacterium]|nr:MBL fold metallo-hydrolase [Acidobacteriota bacterium]